MKFKITACLFVAVACNFQACRCLALTTTATTKTSCQKPGASAALIGSQRQQRYRFVGSLSQGSFHALYSSPDPDNNMSADEEENQQQEKMPPAYAPPPPTPGRNSPEAVAQRRMDPLMASLTRDNSDAEQTQNVPFFGEIPADGTLFLLVPATVFALLGFVLSLVIAVRSSDQIVDSFSHVGDNIAQTASERTNRVYDENKCRGFCGSPQQEDVDGLRNFMEAITRSAREGK